MRKRRALFGVAGLLIFLSFTGSCRMDISQPDVYVAGAFDEGQQQACYWLNGMRRTVPGTTVAMPATVNSISAADGRVYLAGAIDWSNFPCFWEGTARTDLELLPGTGGGRGSAITVSRGTVYVAGDCNSLPCVWTNGGIPTALLPSDSPAGAMGCATDIQVYRGTVYIAGYYNYQRDLPCYWVKGAQIDLHLPGSSSARTIAIHISEGTVHTAGFFNDGSGEKPCRWEGTSFIELNLPTGGIEGRVESIFVDRGTVYATGMYRTIPSTDNYPCYWVNDVVYKLDTDGQQGYTYSVCIFQGDVYIAGVYTIAGDGQPCYWKNSVRTDLPCGVRGGATSIVVR